MRYFQKHIYIVLLLIIVSILFVTNYTHGTFLMGWDNLQTDLNPWLGVKRALWSGWQEYQSFGLPAGMAHASDLVRALWVWLLSFVIPTSLIRYVVHFTLVGVGAVGAFTLIRSLVKSTQAYTVAFVGSLFYLLNFYTIQILALPFEAFTFFFAFLPWELWIFIRLISSSNSEKEQSSREEYRRLPAFGGKQSHNKKLNIKYLLFFIFINVLATPQAYAQQIFAVYLLTLGVTSLAFLISTKDQVTLFKKSLIAIVLIFAINSFWILPQIYFLKTSANIVTQSKMNQMATDHVWNQNKAYGNLPDFALMNNFFTELKGKDGAFLFGAWNAHRSNPIILLMEIMTALMVFVGVIISFLRKQYIVLGLLVLCMVALLINTFPFDLITNLSRQIPILHQIFRSPFTKFAVVYSLTVSLSFAFLIEKALSSIKHSFIRVAFVITLVLLIIVPSIPAWYGNYVSPTIRVALPTAYTDLFSYFQTQNKNARIGLLPEYTYWGWYHNRWGYDGSGFIWYGIEQPIVSRTFDVWSKQSENYFWELQSALIAEDNRGFTNILEKYRIDYLVYDASVKPIVGMDELFIHDRTKTLLASNSNVKLEKSFGNILFVYKVIHQTASDSFVRITPPLVTIHQDTDATSQDVGYATSGEYESDTGNSPEIYIPFANLNSQSQGIKNWNITHVGETFHIASTIPPGFMIGQYAVHQTCPTEECAGDVLSARIKGRSLEIAYPAVLSYEANLEHSDIQSCDARDTRGTVSPKDNKTINITTANPQSTCIGYSIPSLPHDTGYILEIESDHISGRNLSFYMNDLTMKQTVLDDVLNEDTEYYVIPPRSNTGIGYSLVLQDSPFHGAKHENILKSIHMYELPFESISHLQFQSPRPRKTNKTTESKIRSVQKNSNFSYTVQVDIKDSSFLILDQAFDPGWIAIELQNSLPESDPPLADNSQFSMGNIKVLPHIKVNGWENAWLLEEQPKPANQSLREPQRGYAKANGKMGRGWTYSTIYLLFWPQYLEYGGFGLLALSLGILGVRQVRKMKTTT